MKELRLAAVVLVLGATAGCLKFGTVNQGWVVEYLAAEGRITLIPDAGPPTPVTFKVPENPREMGPAPAAGHLVGINLRDRQLTVFDPALRNLKTISFNPVTQADNLSRDDPRVARKGFPMVDRERRTVTFYLPRERRLLTVEVAGELLALPEITWRFGDVIRYYYKDPQRALRVMNVSRTDLGKAGE